MSDQDRIERPFADEPDDRPPTNRDRRLPDSSRLSAGPGQVEGGDEAAAPVIPAANDSSSNLLLIGGVFVGVFVVALAAANVVPGTKPPAPKATTPTPVATVSPPRPRVIHGVEPTPEEKQGHSEINSDAARGLLDFKDDKPPPPRPAPSLKNIDGLLADLKNTDDDAARSAAEGLVRQNPRSVAPALRREIVFTLIYQGGEKKRLAPETLRDALLTWAGWEDLDPLKSLVKNVDARLRAVGVTVVAGLRNPKAAGLLVAALEFDSNRSEASAALRKIGAPCEKDVWKSLTSANPRVRQEACAILAVVGSNDSVPHLQDRTFEEDQAVRAEAESAIAAIAAR